jgi:hypothetical protein
METTASMTQQTILEAMARVYEGDPEYARKLCLLKGRLFDKGMSVFDVVNFTPDRWLQFGVAGRANTVLVEAMEAVKRERVPKTSSAASAWSTEMPPTPRRCHQPKTALAIDEPIGKKRMALPQETTVMAVLCTHHGMPPPDLWHHEPLTSLELVQTEDKDGLWDNSALTKVLHSLHDRIQHPGKHAKVWYIVDDPNFFWNSIPVGHMNSKMWATGWWKGAASGRWIQFGCIHCGCRTPTMYLSAPAACGKKSGRDQIIEALQALFEA